MEDAFRALVYPRATKTYKKLRDLLESDDKVESYSIEAEKLAVRGLKRKLSSEVVANVESYSSRVQLAKRLRGALAQDMYAYSTPDGAFDTEKAQFDESFDY
jgi:hypothetical protein